MADRTQQPALHTPHYQRLFMEVRRRVSSEPQWLVHLRAVAMDRFGDLGFPLPSDEEWRFTPVGPIAETPFAFADGGGSIENAPAQPLTDLSPMRIVLANGRYVGDHRSLDRLPAGVVLCSLRTAVESRPDLVATYLGALASDGPSLTSLNTALHEDGVFVYVPSGVVVEAPIVIHHVGSASSEKPAVLSPRVLVVAESNNSLTIVEVYSGATESAHWTNAVTEVAIGANTIVEHYRLQHEPLTAYHTARTAVALDRDSRYTSFVVQTGGSIARHDLGAILRGEGGCCTLNGLYVGRERQLMDNHTVIDHAVAHCESHELYKGILDGRAHGVFNGKVYVRPDAQKTDAKQSNQTLLLSEGARVDTKPQLEIFADDVRCTHGATVGQLDADAMFYLRSRGFATDDARSVLVHAFASEIVDRMTLARVRGHVEGILLERLPRPSSLAMVSGAEEWFA